VSTRSSVLEALKAAGPSGVSGERIAHQLGVSRVAIGKHIASLRRTGYCIDARAGEGYTLTSCPDLPLPDEVVPLLTSRLWVRVEGTEATGSTNDDARVLADAGASEGTVVLAGRQSAGRGRFQRQWASPQGGVYASMVFRPPVSAVELAPLSLVIAVGVARGLERLGAAPVLKWPNDVQLGEKKVAGVLLEMSGQADCVEWVVAGVGLNVASLNESDLVAAAALSEEVGSVRTAEAAAAVLDGIASAYDEWLTDGFAGLRTEFADRHCLLGRGVTVRDMLGRVVASGTVEDVDELGRLVVACADGTREIASGEVTLKAG